MGTGSPLVPVPSVHPPQRMFFWYRRVVPVPLGIFFCVQATQLYQNNSFSKILTYRSSACTKKIPFQGDVHFVQIHVGCLYPKKSLSGGCTLCIGTRWLHVPKRSLFGGCTLCTGARALPVPKQFPLRGCTLCSLYRYR